MIDHELCVEIVRMESAIARAAAAARYTDAQELTDAREQLLVRHWSNVRSETGAQSAALLRPLRS